MAGEAEAATPVIVSAMTADARENHTIQDNNENESDATDATLQNNTDADDTFKPPEAGSAVTVINCLCNVIGGGILTLPSAFANSSMVVGLILLILLIGIAMTTIFFIVECAERKQLYEYRKLIQLALGKKMTFLVGLALFLFPFGALIAYSDIIADIMPSILLRVPYFQERPDNFLLTRYCWILAGGLFFFLLSCRRSLNELFVSSLFGVLTIFFLIIVIVVRFYVPFVSEDVFVNNTQKTASHPPWSSSWSQTTQLTQVSTAETPVRGAGQVYPGFEPIYFSYMFIQTVPVIVFSLSVHNNAPTYYQELKDRSPAKMYRLFGIAFLIIGLSYATISIFGLMSFGEQLGGEQHSSLAVGNVTIEPREHNGDITTLYSDDDTAVTVARGLLFVHFVCVYPILALATRRAFNSLAFNMADKDMPRKNLYIESFFITAIAAFIALIVPNIETVVTFNGAIFGTIVVMVAPACIFLSVDPMRDERLVEDGGSQRSNSSGNSDEQEMLETNLVEDGVDTGAVEMNDRGNELDAFERRQSNKDNEIWAPATVRWKRRKRLFCHSSAYAIIIFGCSVGVTSVVATIFELAS